MSDDQPTRDESAIPFSERVTIDTLADRPLIPSFDTSPYQWDRVTGLRLEGSFTTSHLGSSPIHEGKPVVLVFGPRDEAYDSSFDGPPYDRPLAIFNKETGWNHHSVADSDRFTIIDTRRETATFGGVMEFKETLIREGDSIEIAERFTGTDDGEERTVGKSLFKIETIKSGPLT